MLKKIRVKSVTKTGSGIRDRGSARLERETTHARAGLPARIIAKFNSLVDERTIEALYRASQAGVKIQLFIRGFCCLRPDVPGLSDNIKVTSVVGRFLEHSRVFHFGGGHADPIAGEWFIGSADWMYRNLEQRVEAITPVLDPEARRRLQRMIEVMTVDHRHAWDLLPTGNYTMRQISAGMEPDSPEAMGTFATLMRDANAVPAK